MRSWCWWWPVLIAFSACAPSRTVPATTLDPTAATPATASGLSLFGQPIGLGEAVDLVDQKRWDDAAPALRSLLGDDPRLDDYVLYHLGVAEARLGDSRALHRFTRVRTEYPQSLWGSPAALEIGRLYRQQGQAQEAEAFLSAAATASDADIAAQAKLEQAQLLIAAGRDVEAVRLLQEIRETSKGAPVVIQARTLVRGLRAQNPAVGLHGREWLPEARLLLDERDYVGAEKAVRAADPAGTDVDTTFLLAEAFKGQGNTAAAVTVLGAVVDREAGTPAGARALFRMAQLLWNQDEDVAAEASFHQFLKRYPRHPSAPDALYALGRIHQADGRHAAAATSYERLAKTYPKAKTAWEARWRIGWLRYLLRRFAEAAASFGSLARSSREPADVASARYWQARSLERAGRPSEANELYRRVIAEAPLTYYAWRAEGRLGEDRFDDAGRIAAATLPLPDPPPSLGRFHLERYLALRDLGLSRFARREAAALERESSDAAARRFVYYAYANADDYPAARRIGRDLDIPGGVRERVLYPLAFWDDVSAATDRHHVDPLLVVALIRQESLFDPRARSFADARGLMQLLPATAQKEAATLGWKEDPTGRLYDPAVNVALGVQHFRTLLDLYDGDPVKALAAYNGGTRAVDKWRQQFAELEGDEFVESITYRETRDYVKRVLGNRRAYALLYASGA
jgi:soluble lytic murein transglycosylase